MDNKELLKQARESVKILIKECIGYIFVNFT